MKKRFENGYGKAMTGVFHAVNPIKKRIMKTNCTVHKFIVIQAVEILKNDGYLEEYNFFKKYVKNMNEGVTWADQDFKSSNHFYYSEKGRGLYGFSNALTECNKYYKKGLNFYKAGDTAKAMFFFGASSHLIQDATVPHHGNNKLLKSHRKFELWIISKLMSDYSFAATSGLVKYETVDDYIINNANMANRTLSEYINIQDREERYSSIAVKILKEAQITTAGLMLNFYNDIKKQKNLP